MTYTNEGQNFSIKKLIENKFIQHTYFLEVAKIVKNTLHLNRHVKEETRGPR